MKSFLQYIDDKTLSFYMESIEGYSEFIEYRKGNEELPKALAEKLKSRTETELALLENKLLFKYLNHLNWEVECIAEDTVEAATNWEMETLKNG